MYKKIVICMSRSLYHSKVVKSKISGDINVF